MLTVAATAGRRRRLAKIIGEGLIILRSPQQAVASRDTHYHPYQPNAYLRYLTGCPQPHTAFLMTVINGEPEEEILFCRPADPQLARWEGQPLNPKSAATLYKMRTADLTTFDAQVARRAEKFRTLFHPVGGDPRLDTLANQLLSHRRAGNRRGGRGPTTISDLAIPVDEMRLTKDADERAAIRQACAITCDGIREAMRAAPRAKNEYEVEAALIHRYRSKGGHHAFPPIVAGGKNACTLHYSANDAPLKKNALLLIDSGCQWNGYCGDVTRTFPANGKWREEQRAIYDIVLSAQLAAIRAVKPGATWPDIENAAGKELIAGLRHLKLCHGNPRQLLNQEKHRRFYMHRIGHWLGLDVHDVGDTELTGGRPRPLRPGMVITIEPGLYLPTERDIPAPLRGIGIRIEDDLLITPKGNEILTAAAPKTPAAISEWMLR